MDTKKRNSKEITKSNNSDNIFLKKHVGLIHCENKLTLIQRKICNILLFNALDKINDQDIHEISLRQLCSLVGYNSNDSKLIKNSIKSLISVVMEWNLLEDNRCLNENENAEDMITWNASSLLAGASIRKGVITYSYSPQMKSVLSSLDIYGRINLFVQAKFNSTYSLVLYENCVRFKNIKQTSWFSIELFRSLMGVSKEKYVSFKELNRNVIHAAIKEINQKADIYIEAKFKKSGRNIIGLQFILSDNKNYLPTFKKITKIETPSSFPQQQANLSEILLSEFKLTEKQASKMIAEYAYDYIMEKIKLVKTKKNIEHAGAYLISALKSDYQFQEEKIKKENIKVIENSYLRESKAASEITSLKNKYMQYKTKTYTQFLQKQVEKLQQTIYEKFENFLRPKPDYLRYYKRSGFSSPFVASDFIGFMEAHFPEVIGEYLSFDDFITSEEF